MPSRTFRRPDLLATSRRRYAVFLEARDMSFIMNSGEKARKQPRWTRAENRGCPRKLGRGKPEEFHWKVAAVVLILLNYLGLGYRVMTVHLRCRAELVRRLELDKAAKKSPSHRSRGRPSGPGCGG